MSPRSAGLILKALRQPGVALRVGMSLAKGAWCKWWLPLRGIRFRAGRNLRVEGRLIVRGPGLVELGDNVIIGMRVTPWTYHRDAVIRIGAGTFVNGTSFGCERSIDIGANCILADARIMDTDFHSVRSDRTTPDAPVRVAPVRVADNVWIAAQVGILPGTHIGANSVVGFGAVCAGDYPADMIIAGNPARVVGPVPHPPGDEHSSP